jgi:serine/threonine-protein kinase
MTRRGCIDHLLFSTLLIIAFGLSSYFWFTYFVRGRSIATPNLVGRQITDARAISSDLGLVVIVDHHQDRPSNDVPKGAVVWQNRTPGNLIKRGTNLHVGESLGPLVLSVPDLSGQSPRTALLRFSQRNLRLGNLSYVDVPGGRGIVAEDPPRGTVVQGQTAVSLLVAFEPDPPAFVMPDLIDRPLNLVRPLLESHGLQVTNVRYESYPGIQDGTIIRQFPLHGHRVSTKEAITLVVTQNQPGGMPPLAPTETAPAGVPPS